MLDHQDLPVGIPAGRVYRAAIEDTNRWDAYVEQEARKALRDYMLEDLDLIEYEPEPEPELEN